MQLQTEIQLLLFRAVLKGAVRKTLSPDVEKVIENRDMFIAQSEESQRIPVISDEKAI